MPYHAALLFILGFLAACAQETSANKNANTEAIAPTQPVPEIGQPSSGSDEKAYLQQAKALGDKCDYKGAIVEYGKAIAIRPEDGTAYKNRGWARLMDGDPAGAVPDFTKAIELNPNDAEAYSGRASSKIDWGNLDGGIADYNEAIRLNPNDSTSYSGRGKAELAEKKFNEAISDCDQAIARSPIESLAIDYSSRGDAKSAQGDYDGAIADFTKSLTCTFQFLPGNAYYGRGLAKFNKGDIDGALTDYNSAVQAWAKYPSPPVYTDRGYARFLKGDLDGAISDETEAIALYARAAVLPHTHYLEDTVTNDYYSAAYNRRGLARNSKNDLAGAVSDYGKAIELSPKYAAAYRNRGLVESKERAFDEAVADFSKAIEINPKYVAAYHNRGSVESAKGDFDAAIADFTKAIALNPRIIDLYTERGFAESQKRDFTHEFIDMQKAADSGSVLGQVMVGSCYEVGSGVAKNYGEAVKWYKRAAYQGNAEAQHQLALMYFNGAGVPKDELEALAWINIAASTGRQDLLKLRTYFEYRLGEQATLVAQQRSREILQNIRTETKSAVPGEPSPGVNSQIGGQPNATGTGVLITNDGEILTAAHVVKGARAIKVVTPQGVKVATVTSIDVKNDVALLKCEGSFQAAPIKDSGNVKLGQPVFTIGFPDVQLQGFSPKMTRGEISSQTGIQDDPRDWQISVPVQPGNSGGPLFDEDGNVIGIVVAKLDAAITAQVTGSLPENVNYAVKSSYALTLLQPYRQNLLPEVKPSNTPDKIEDVVGRVQNSVVLILAY